MVRRFAIVLFLALATSMSAVGSIQAWQESETPPWGPGVLREIPPDKQIEDTFTGPMPLPELLIGHPETAFDPNYSPKSRTIQERAKQVILRREVWYLDFAFKPMRMIEVDVPQPSGKMQRKLIWYLVYRVRYTGDNLKPVGTPDRYGNETFQPQPAYNESGRFFFPHFVLTSLEFNKSYLDRVIPSAVAAIQERELPDGTLHNSVEITKHPVPYATDDPQTGIWGVATWEDIDPRIDYFSVYVQGLTNAYRPVDVPDAFQAGDPPGTGRDLLSKTLRLNFWRPGDAIRETEDEIRFGVPVEDDATEQAEILRAYGLPERLDYSWVYR